MWPYINQWQDQVHMSKLEDMWLGKHSLSLCSLLAEHYGSGANGQLWTESACVLTVIGKFEARNVVNLMAEQPPLRAYFLQDVTHDCENVWGAVTDSHPAVWASNTLTQECKKCANLPRMSGNRSCLISWQSNSVDNQINVHSNATDHDWVFFGQDATGNACCHFQTWHSFWSHE